MSATNNVNQAGDVDVVAAQPTCMESVNRIAKLPVVESTIQTAHNIYGKVKDYNSITNWTLQTAEDTAHKAVDIAKPYAVPVMKNFEGPIKKVDDVLCSGLDYVESKVPAVKLPPKELILQIYNNTKEMVTPAMETAKSYMEPAVETAKSYVEPAVQTAKDILEPAVAKTRSIVEPIVEPIVENVKHQVDEYLHRNQDAPEGQEQKPTPEGQQQKRKQPQKNEASPESSFESQRSQGELDASS